MLLHQQLRSCIVSTHARNVDLFKKAKLFLSPVYTIKRAFIRRYLARHTRQISSFGGSGTSMLCRFLEQKDIGLPKVVEADWAPWKHMRHPPLDHTVQQNFRALYLVADPRDAILSVFRRGYQHWHIQRMEGDVLSWNYSWDLEQFLAHRYDHFKIEEHFDNWTKDHRRYPIMIVKYDALWRHLPEVFGFIGAPLESIAEFPQWKERNVNWRMERKEIRDALNLLYGDLAEEIAMMKDINLSQPER